ncbi:hypothetical protein KOR42_07690 [Thalassoglobus neptunius]|uniref:DUF4013 domain-containing protein n=1 Tax=Thalassoglobus neptunius TaxID=1938619 RepID=A0A5C5X3M8_9PLAN|nr:DUF4013 domain-containing protein [Thalassoglobus neptunius]TWT57408.1 hypothetical protein KOR42_07690 [Thalassoglobus neptunius]
MSAYETARNSIGGEMQEERSTPSLHELQVDAVTASHETEDGHGDSFSQEADEIRSFESEEVQATRGWMGRALSFTWWGIGRIFALTSLVLILAVLAAIPIVNFFVLGYFLRVEGAVARTGKIRNGFPLLDQAPRIATVALGIWVFLLPLRFLGSFAADAALIALGSPAEAGWKLALTISWIAITGHLLFAIARGGSLSCFLRPLKNVLWFRRQVREGNYFRRADQAIQEFFASLEVGKTFLLGVKGFAVAFIWLVLPTGLLAIAREPEGGQLIFTVLGGAMLAIVLSWAPFLQARFACEQRFAAGVQLREIRSLWQHAPIAWTLALIVLYLLTIPLYLFKAFLLPPEAMWPITLIFVVTILPTRILLGSVYARAVRKRESQLRSHFSIRWTCGAILIAALCFYVFILFFTQFLGEQGKLVLFHHHSMLLPAPFQGAIDP